jgi:hypothetical protein
MEVQPSFNKSLCMSMSESCAFGSRLWSSTHCPDRRPPFLSVLICPYTSIQKTMQTELLGPLKTLRTLNRPSHDGRTVDDGP